MFGLKNLLDEKDMYSNLHRVMFGRHMSDINPSWVFTSDYSSLILTIKEYMTELDKDEGRPVVTTCLLLSKQDVSLGNILVVGVYPSTNTRLSEQKYNCIIINIITS